MKSTLRMIVNLIVAHDATGGIGLNNALPWPKLKEDMQWFRKHTTGHICVMGSKTWKSLPVEYRPLPNRINVVYTSMAGDPIYAQANQTLNGGRIEAAITYLERTYNNKDIFVIGGKQIFEQWLPYVDFIHRTQIKSTFKCDTFLDIKTHLNSCSLKYNKQAVWRQTAPTHKVIPYNMETYECNNT